MDSEEKKCECGAAKTNETHAWWCPVTTGEVTEYHTGGLVPIPVEKEDCMVELRIRVKRLEAAVLRLMGGEENLEKTVTAQAKLIAGLVKDVEAMKDAHATLVNAAIDRDP